MSHWNGAAVLKIHSSRPLRAQMPSLPLLFCWLQSRFACRRNPKIILCNCLPEPIPEVGASMLEIFHHIDAHKQWFTAKELAALLDRTDQFVRDLFESRRILGHTLCARGTTERRVYQAHRRAVELYLLETANFHPDEYVHCLAALVRKLPKKQRDLLRDLLQR
jgi:hypothetical protein